MKTAGRFKELAAVTMVAVMVMGCGGGTKPSELAGQWEYGSGARNVKDLGRVPEQIELFKDGTGVVEGNSISWKVENKRLVFLSSQSGFACNYKLSGYALTFIDDNGDSATFVRKGKLEEFKVKQAAAAEAAAEKERNERIASFEKAGDEAYDIAKQSTGGARHMQLKNAYVNYDKAVKSNPDKISNKLRERYLDMCIARVQLILDEGNASMTAIPLLQNDIDTYLTTNIPADIRQRYATFLAQLGDSSASKARYTDAFAYYDKAIEKAANPAPFKAKRDGIIKKEAEENYERGMMEFEMGKKNKEEAAVKYIRAEYFAKVALHFDPDFQKAQKLLSDCYKINREIYSTYITTVDDYKDTLVFRKVNKLDILIAIPDYKVTGDSAVAIINVYNYSSDHLRMVSEDFSLVDTDGKEYKAAAGKMNPDVLEYEKEAKYTLRFPVPSAPIKKLTYRNYRHHTEHYAEKNFF
jgi:tetratricopeptide (TPR) repeat protein